jgi:CspA family cold shock protein
MAREERKSGTIKRLVVDKGFGFIATSDGTEYFFHRSACTEAWDSLEQGQSVDFTVVPSNKGPRAEAVQPRGSAF